jgi:SAM-dependent methyltransferase
MTSAHAPSKLVGLAYATAKCLVMPGSTGEGWLSFLRHWLKFPLTYQASKALEGVPVATFPELFPGKQAGPISIPPESLDWQIFHIRLDEEVLIGLTVQALGARRIFEIGTFEGGTTRFLADKAGEGAEVFTLDLPEAEFAWSWTQTGRKFRGSAVGPRIKQLFGNSLEFDFSPYERSIDLVFVDAAHDYPHGFADSRTALRLVRPGGVVLWHDFIAHFPGLVHAIIEATAGLPLKRLGMDTTLAFLRTAG